MKVTLLRNACKESLEMSTPSSKIYPVLSSTVLSRLFKIEDLPAPVRPTIPILPQGGI